MSLVVRKRIIEARGGHIALLARERNRQAPFPLRIREEDEETTSCIDAKRRRDDNDDGGAQYAAHFCRPRANPGSSRSSSLRVAFVFVVVVVDDVVFVLFSSFFLLLETAKATKQRSTEEGSFSRYTGERNDSSRRRAVLPRTSHPWFPPALEPLNHSVVQRFEAPVVLNA